MERELARRAKARPKARRRTPELVRGVQPSVIRTWALSEGLDVGTRGRVRDEIVQQYLDAHEGEPA